MKQKLIIMILMAQLLPLSISAQDDDLYFVPKEQKNAEKKVREKNPVDNPVYYCGSNRDVDEYNRRPGLRCGSRLVKTGVDSLGNDLYRFVSDSIYSGSDSVMGKGRRITPGGYDAEDTENYRYTKRMRKFDGYDCEGMDYDDYCYSYRDGYNQGFSDGLTSWNISIGWYDPWWYSSRYYGWNGWYNRYYFGWHGPWYGGWYDPWFTGWYDPWWHGGYYPIYHHSGYYGYSGTRNHSRGSYGTGSRRHGSYNGYNRGNSYRDRGNVNGNRGFGNRNSWNNRNNNRSTINRNNNNRGSEMNRGGFGGSRSNRSGFGGGSRSGGGGRSHGGGGRFGGGR